MYDKTSSAQFKKYGSIYDEPKDLHSDELIQREVVTTDRVISSLYHFSEPVYVEVKDGMAYILIGDSSDG